MEIWGFLGRKVRFNLGLARNDLRIPTLTLNCAASVGPFHLTSPSLYAASPLGSRNAFVIRFSSDRRRFRSSRSALTPGFFNSC